MITPEAGSIKPVDTPTLPLERLRDLRALLDQVLHVVEMACDLAIEQRTLRLPAIINLVNQLLEPTIAPLAETHA